jgi:hypothetical protein
LFLLCSPHIVPDSGSSDDEYDDEGDEGYGKLDDCKSNQVDDYGNSDDDAGRRGNAPTSKSAAVLSMDRVTKVQGRSSKETSQAQKHVAF